MGDIPYVTSLLVDW